jgi:hypothetical protein
MHVGRATMNGMDAIDKDPIVIISRFIAAAVCLLGPLTCTAHAVGINSEATYVSFQVPGSLGTYPMSINNSMTVTGYYYVTPTVTRGFVRDADGTITTFDVDVAGAVWIEPESINARGDITGFYQLAAGIPQGPYGSTGDQQQGFLRYADGRVVSFDPPATGGFPPQAQPVSMSDFDDIAGNYGVFARPAVFTRSAAGVYDAGISFDRATWATAINWAGSVVGYTFPGEGPYTGFVRHPDGYVDFLTIPAQPLLSEQECGSDTIPEGINAAGAIAGWYLNYVDCTTLNTGGFVVSTDGAVTLFQPPGTIVPAPPAGFSNTDPHWISINQPGDITGSYTDPAGVQHGFVRNQYGTITSFDPTEGKQTTATSINDAGAVAGFYHYNKGGGPPVGFIRVLVTPLEN